MLKMTSKILGWSSAAGLLAAAWTAGAAPTVLVEAERFANIGGWKVDAMSVEQMGSPYVIAHGLGTPVTNAATTVAFPETGAYAVWVRTRNWVPAYSNAAAPGRFQVLVDGAPLSPTFGTVNGAWHWQAGGTVTVAAASATVALKDLTGFDGRCDALAFIKGAATPPPASGPALAAWRRAALNEAVDPPVTQQFECVVVGGGMAGCCAAVAAARSGLKVALVQDRPVLGGNASQEIRVGTRGEIRHAIVGELGSPGGNGDDTAVADDTRRLTVLRAEPNLTLLMPWRAYGAGTNAARRITHVDALQTQTGARSRLQAPLFIDCTGDGWIGYWAGADYRVGREAAAEFGESRAPATADAKTMGNTLMWTTETGATPVSFPAVPWAMDVAGTRAATYGGWNWEYGLSLNTITDAEAIRDHLLRAIYGNFYNAKKVAANANLALHWVPYVTGKRESRRLLGDHILVQSEVQKGAYFEDAVGTATWGIDLHYETAVSYLSSYTSTAVAKWYFPFRCLYSRNVPNLMMAGRCISVSHVGLGSPRVMNTCGQMGVAVGYAAAMCKQYAIEPRDIYRSAERTVELQARITGAWPERPLPEAAIVDNADAAPRATIVGDWTSSASVAGFNGTNYLHDGSAGRGTKRVAFSPSLTEPGRYQIALRWAADTNRATNAPVWVCTAPQLLAGNATAVGQIRNAQPNTVFATGEMLVGRVAADEYIRGILRFDLSALPSTAVIVSAELQLTVGARDAASAGGFVGAEGLKVYRLTQPYAPTAVTWNSRTASNAWATAGGDCDAAPVTQIAAPTDPNLTEAGDVFGFPQAAGLTAAAGAAQRQGGVLGLLVRTPTLESTYPTRKLYRFSAARLTVKYFTPALPATYTVNQRVQGGQWVTLGTHELPAEGLTVILGNDGANGYVIADAVRFANENASVVDVDGDGLPNDWERYHFLSETAADPETDDDGDRRSNFIECMTGTDPRSAASRFDMRVRLDAAPDTALRWPSASNLTYRIEVSSNLPAFTPWAAHIPANPPTNTWLVEAAPGERRFYRVVIE